MKKSVSSLLAGLIALLVLPTLLASPAHAVDTEIPCSLGGTFTVSDTKVKAWNQSCLGAITIPAEVTELEFLAFYNSGVTSITFESGSRVKRIGWEAFKISKITSIVLPSGLEYLGASVFNGTGVKTISIPGTVTELDNAAFLGGPESVIFESRVATSLNLGGLLFADVQSGVDSVTFKGPNQLTLDTPPGVGDADFSLGWSTTSNGPLVDFPLANTNPGDLTLYPKLTPTTGAAIVPCSLSGTFRVKEGVVAGSSPNCAGEITVPADVTHINEYSFERRDLTSVSFETGSVLKSIGRSAFAHANISSLVLPPDLEEISYNAFTGLKATSIVIPGKVYYIWDEAFSYTSLESVVFASRPNQDARIRRNVFDNNSRLRSLTFEGPINFDPSTYQFTRRAWNWLGWSATLGGTIVPFAHLNNNSGTITLFANSAPQTYNAIYDSKGGTPVEPGLVVGGQIQFPTPPTRVGYSFDAWYLGADPVTLWERAEDVTLSANWIPNTYAVNLDSKGGSAVPATSFVTDGAITSAPAAPNRNCSALAGWSATDGGPAVSFPYEPKVMADITLFAKWSASPCAVTAGEAENSQVVTVPAGTSVATISATEFLPTVKLNLAGASGQAVVTVAPISNPATTSNTPFKLTESTKIVDINVTGITGRVTVCLDGGATDSLFHFTGGAWVALPERSYVNGQVCGVTSNFSPFAAAVSQSPAEKAAEVAAAEQARGAAAAAAEQARNAAATEQARIAATAAADLAARTVSAKKTLAPNALAKKVGVKVVSSKAKVTMSVAKSSKKNCAVVAGKLKTLKAGNCVVTFTVQEPKPAKGKQPKATKAVKTLVVK